MLKLSILFSNALVAFVVLIICKDCLSWYQRAPTISSRLIQSKILSRGNIHASYVRCSKLFLESEDDNESSIVSGLEGKQMHANSNWYSPNYLKEDIDQWWKDTQKHLLSIGLKGVTESHVNSLNELITHHGLVRVRLASDKIDGTSVAAKLLESPVLKSVELLHARNREMLFGKIKNKSK